MAALSTSNVAEENPYEGHPSLTELEAEVLWQYAKLAQNVKEVRYSLPFVRNTSTPTHRGGS